jgi:hypothetical protein
MWNRHIIFLNFTIYEIESNARKTTRKSIEGKFRGNEERNSNTIEILTIKQKTTKFFGKGTKRKQLQADIV